MSNYLFALIINGVILAAWLVLFFKNRKKSFEAIKVGLQTIFSMLPLLLIIIGFIGIFISKII